jgi:hypothetical protein
MKFKLVERFIHEGYNIAYSGYIILNTHRDMLSREWALKETNNFGRMWVDNISDAFVFRDESEAYKYRQWLYDLYDGGEDFYIKYVESNKDLDNISIKKYIEPVIQHYEQFIRSAMSFESLANEHSMSQYRYTVSDYNSGEPAPALLVSIFNSPNDTLSLVRRFYTTIVERSGLPETDSKLIDAAQNFVNSWNTVMSDYKEIPSNYRSSFIELLQKVEGR